MCFKSLPCRSSEPDGRWWSEIRGSAGVQPGKANARLMTNYRRSLVFAGPATALALVLATPAPAQTPEAPAQPEDATTVQPGAGSAAGAPSEEFTEEGEEIVVTGVRRGTVIGDIPPENGLTA